MADEDEQVVTVTTISNVKAPEEFNFQKPEGWPTYIKRFERYISVANLSNKADKEKIDLLCYTMGEKSEDILKQILPDLDENTEFTRVMQGFADYFAPKKNSIFERFKFNSRVQQPGESVDAFITHLHSLAENCEYGTLKNELIRDRILIGILDPEPSKRMQLDPALTLEKAINIARQAETQAKQGKQLRQSKGNDIEVNKITYRNKSRNTRQKSNAAAEATSCGRCGLKRHDDAAKCPALRSTCNKCQKVGHWERACRTRNVRRVERADDDSDSGADSNETLFLRKFGCYGHTPDEDFSVNIEIKELDSFVLFDIDTGADVSCISPGTLPEALKNKVKPTNKLIFGPDGKRLSTKGYINLMLQYSEVLLKAKIYIIHGIKQNLLGKPEIKGFGLIKTIKSISQNMISSVDAAKEYPGVFKGIGTLKTVLKIHLKDDSKPFAITVPRTVALPLLPKLKAELNRLLQEGVIVPVDFPTEWCSPIVVVPKAESGEIRLCGDYTQLNKSVKRAVYPTQKVDMSLAQLKGAKIFSKLDARAGYHQLRLEAASQQLTTFITPFGRYMYTRLPYGVNCASDYFAREFSRILADMANVITHIDDILIFGETVEKHDAILRKVLDRLKENGVALNKSKCIIGVKEVTYLGHRISENGISIMPERVSAISNFPAPVNKEKVLQFLSIINYVSKFIPNKSTLLEPLQSLLKGDAEFLWSTSQQRAFESSKALIQKAPTLAHYDYSLKIIIQADASSYGLGSVLMQENSDVTRGIVAFASRVLTDCEKRYSQIEKETLALVFATDRFKEYILGIQVTLETDHKPLLQTLQTKPLDELTPRLQGMRLRLMRYNYTITYIPGKSLVLADSLSRNPEISTSTKPHSLENDANSYIRFIVSNLPVTPNMLERIKSEQKADHICLKLSEYSTSGWPSKNSVPKELTPYYQHRDDISICNDFLLFSSRLIIPPSLQLEVLARIHEGHLGINKCRDRAKQAVWWIGLSAQLANLVEFCEACVQNRQNIREPFVKENFPERPWQKIALDLFKCEKWYLIATDYYSRFIEISPLKSHEEREIISHCKQLFARYGIPEVVRSDPGTQFATDFYKFSQEYDFKLITNSAKFSQSNGAVEAAVKIAKNIIKKNEDVDLGLLAYRTTPLDNGFSPAEMMFSRKVRSRLPTLPNNLGTFVEHKKVESIENTRKSKQEAMYNKRHRTKKLSTLNIGDMVWVIDKHVYGQIIDLDESPNSYILTTQKGSKIRRNRWHLVPAPYKEDVKNDRVGDVIVTTEDTAGEAIAPQGNNDSRREDDNNVRINNNDPPAINVQNPGDPELRRSERERRPPSRYGEFVFD